MAAKAKLSRPQNSEYATIARQWAAAKAEKQARDAMAKLDESSAANAVQGSSKEQRRDFTTKHTLLVAWLAMLVILHAIGMYLFMSGFLLTRLVLDQKSECSKAPIDLQTNRRLGNAEIGCWHPKAFDKAVLIVVDALRYDFTVPYQRPTLETRPQHYHDALRVLYETANSRPENAVLLPFIADPPTTTLQRLKGLTTGTLPTFIDAGSNFAGEAIDEDNLIGQLAKANRTVVHLGDNTWHALFPGYFEPNLTRAYDSFNVWDLHTVDEGVIEHILPLLKPENTTKWDFLIGHLLGVDHAGHRYGPNHAAMAAKLQQMDSFIANVMANIDENTLLIVLGDHGMDSKGDHGGESEDETEAALFLYSKLPFFGRHLGRHVGPSLTAKDKPVAQVDLVPTLSLLLGLPIPFNNLGFPIFEAFAGSNEPNGPNFENLARVGRITSAQITRYINEYAKVRKIDELATSREFTNSDMLFDQRLEQQGKSDDWQAIYTSFQSYQQHILRQCKTLWARFDVVSMVEGIVVLALSLSLMLVYCRGLSGDLLDLHRSLVLRGGLGLVAGALLGLTLRSLIPIVVSLSTSLTLAAIGSILGSSTVLLSSPHRSSLPFPSSTFSWFSLIVIIALAVGFASNSYTIWEDGILLFFLASASGLMLMASLRQTQLQNATLGSYHAILFGILTRVASYSKLCREEQMPYCQSTYYPSGTGVFWHLAVPVIVAAILPGIIKQYYNATSSYRYSAVYWFGFVFRGALGLSALYWIINAADDHSWYPAISEQSFKTLKNMIAQTTLGLSIPVGYSIFAWSNPFLAITSQKLGEPAQVDLSKPPQAGILSSDKKSRVIIHGIGNVHGSRYFPLLTVWAGALILLQKPLGGGAIAILLWQILCLVEVLACTNLQKSAFGPVILALLGSFHYFTTGHQAVLSSLQWDAAFIPLRTIRQPWSALLIVLNTLGPHIICALAAVLLPLWRAQPRQRQLLSDMARSATTHLASYAAIMLATSIWSMWLRRHLMLFRVFCPRWLLAAVVLIGADMATVLVGLSGARWWALSVGDILEIPE